MGSISVIEGNIESERKAESAEVRQQGTMIRTACRNVLQRKELSSSNPPLAGGGA